MVRRVVTALLLFAAAGCATTVPLAPHKARPVPAGLETSQTGWWYARYQIRWRDGQEPAWHIDALLAHQVVAPVLIDHKPNILLWRFHRRAARDAAGHQFSFIVYTSPESAQAIFDQLQANKLLQTMKATGWITRESYDDTASIGKPFIEDTSDPNWSDPVKKSWPFFIMGVSEMWLTLIDELAQPELAGKSATSLERMLAIYLQVNQRILELWREEGRHALLHHLNALFGYEPTLVYEKRLMSF
jgi:hypothetical protein